MDITSKEKERTEEEKMERKKTNMSTTMWETRRHMGF